MKNELLYLLRTPKVHLAVPKVDFDKLYDDPAVLTLLEAPLNVIHRAHYVAEGSGYVKKELRVYVAHKVLHDYQQVMPRMLRDDTTDVEGRLHASATANLYLHGFVVDGRDEGLPLQRDDHMKILTITRQMLVELNATLYDPTNLLTVFKKANDKLFKALMGALMKEMKGKCNPAVAAEYITQVFGCRLIRPEELNPGLMDPEE